MPGYSRLPARSRTGAQAAGRQAASRAEHLDPPVRQPAQPQPEPRRPTAPGRPGGGRIKANIRVIEWGELIRRAKNGEHDLLFMGWAGDNGDPDNFLTPHQLRQRQVGLNFARYCDPGPDKLIADGKAASSQEQRTGLYHQAQKLIHEQALWLPLAHPTAFALTRQEVQGYQVNPFGRQDFSRVAVNAEGHARENPAMDLDRLYLPHWQFSEHHQRLIDAPAAAVLDAVEDLLRFDDPLVRAFLVLREAPEGWPACWPAQRPGRPPTLRPA